MNHKEQLEKLKTKHKTWGEVASILGVTPQTVGNWRRWDSIPDRASKQIAGLYDQLIVAEAQSNEQ